MRAAKRAVARVAFHVYAASATFIHNYLLLLSTVISMPCSVRILKNSRSKIGSFDERENVTRVLPLYDAQVIELHIYFCAPSTNSKRSILSLISSGIVTLPILLNAQDITLSPTR